MINEWIKPGARVYIKSFSNWVKSGYTTIVRVDKEYFYLQRDSRIKVDISTLKGNFLNYHDICHIYQSKEDIKPNIDISPKRKTNKENLHLLSENEIDNTHSILIKSKMNYLDKAIQIASNAHANQVDKAGMSYILHPLRVMFKMRTEYEMITAVLHDVVEDCRNITAYYLEKQGFTKEIVDTLVVLNRRNYTSYEKYIYEVAKHPIARAVKLADLEDNINILRLKTIADEDVQRIKKYHWAYNYLKYGIE